MTHKLDPVAQFWDEQSAAFTADDGRLRYYHSEFAAILNREIAGNVLCVGGLYQNIALDPRRRVAVVDVSEQMLRVWAARGLATVCGDARGLPVASASVDHVVFPLVLHHITDGEAGASRENVAACLREANRVLRPGGTMWAIEILVSTPVYWAERLLAPVTRLALGTRGIPLVIFHTPRFYLSRLAAAGFAEASLTRSQADLGAWYRLIRPIIGLSLRVPRFVVPVKYGLLRAVKPH
jgi:SAM-dependent methyltransferase